MLRQLSLAAALSLAAPTLAHAERILTATSPDGTLEVILRIDGSDRPTWFARKDGETVMGPGRLGMRFAARPAFEEGIKMTGLSRGTVDETWEQPWGERRLVRDAHEEMVAVLIDAEGREIDLRLRVFDDGFGFRYEVPE